LRLSCTGVHTVIHTNISKNLRTVRLRRLETKLHGRAYNYSNEYFNKNGKPNNWLDFLLIFYNKNDK